MNKALKMPDVRDASRAWCRIVGGSSKEFAEHIRREIPKWAKVVKAIDVHLD